MTRAARLRLAAGAAVAALLALPLLDAGPTALAQRAADRLAATFGRREAAPAVAGPAPLAFRHLTTEQGLPAEAVNAVAQDALGFLWIGTPDGLVRYDGAEMRPFRYAAADSSTVPGNVTTALAPTPRRAGAYPGGLYVGTTDGLARYDPAREAFARIAGLPTPDVTALAVDAGGTAWVGTVDGGLSRVAPSARRARRALPAARPDAPGGSIFSLFVDASDAVWAGTAGGVVRLAPGTRRARYFRADSVALAPVSALAARAAGGLYVGTQGTGLWRFTPQSGRYVRIPLGTDPGALAVTSVYEDAAGTLWVGLLGGGLRRVDPDGTVSVSTPRPDDPTSLIDDDVSALLEDRQGVLWVATYEGLSRVDLARGAPARFRADPTRADALSSNTVHTVLPLPGRLYVGTDRGLDISSDGKSFAHVRFPVAGGRDTHPVMALAQTADGTVWVGTRGADLYRMQGATPRPVALGRSAIARSVLALLVTPGRDGETVWAGTEADGLWRVGASGDGAVGYRHDPARPASLASNEVRALARSRDGGLWAGTAAGVCRLADPAPPGTFACLRADAANPRALVNDDVQALAVQGDSALWIGTRGGLFRLDPRQPAAGVRAFTAATTDLPGDVVYAIAEGELGLLWLSTSGGLVRFDPATGVFTQRVGRAGQALGSGRALAWRDTLLYAGGIGGLLQLNPSSLRAVNLQPPQTVLTGVDVGGRPVVPGPDAPLEVGAPVARTLHLRPGQDYVTFRFAGLHFADPAALTYRFRLAGDHGDWRQAGTRREATYTNLPPRRYTFQVAARTADGVVGPPATITVVVHPPWYRTVWALLGFGVLGVLALVQWGRWQRSRAMEQARAQAERRETELRAETAEAERRKAEAERREATAERREAEAETERQRAEAVALKAENARATAELERTREVQEANAKLAAANDRLEASLRDLQATQAQLVQSEKLASLGQLTAGIAHEIKNPLNFVNNFAELSIDLVSDIEADLRAAPERPVAEALAEVEDLLADLRDNAVRIREHGQRADRIVRSMLLHSRGGSSERARVDANRYVDEYANLAYHGARANNPDFNVALVRELDPDAGEIEVVPQEFGRVLINLITNAFHAVHARREADPDGYQPTVTLRTRRDARGLTLDVADNGTGIPPAVQARIFEPFFTTKAAGEGTGLGLSLVHDIVTQMHGGTITFESRDGEGTTFSILLPTAGTVPAAPERTPAPDAAPVG